MCDVVRREFKAPPSPSMLVSVSLACHCGFVNGMDGEGRYLSCVCWRHNKVRVQLYRGGSPLATSHVESLTNLDENHEEFLICLIFYI